MDFGLARLGGSEMTRTGMVMGTPHYMSPEQVRGERADSRSDVFSLGCVFYELLTDRKPFDADSMHAVLFKVMQEEPRAGRRARARPPPRAAGPDRPHAGQGPRGAPAGRRAAAHRAAPGPRSHRRRPRRRSAARAAGRRRRRSAPASGRAGAGPETRRPTARGSHLDREPLTVALPPPRGREPARPAPVALAAVRRGASPPSPSPSAAASSSLQRMTSAAAGHARRRRRRARRWTGSPRSWWAARSSWPRRRWTPATIAARPARRSGR